MLTMNSTPASLAACANWGGGLNDAGADRIAEIRPLDAAQCCAHRIEIKKITINDLGTELLEPF
jgi:hypothetical protein